ncbi:MAG: hypothetical protein C0478_03230 [Planctomyces sp.]|nr:hypothetical protein [Planctomyces sp.]
MKSQIKFRIPLAVSLLCLQLAVSGCGNNGEGFTLAPVDGRVVLDGKPVADALVKFDPSKGPSSHVMTDASGQFTLSTTSSKGAVVGSHSVIVTLGVPTRSEQTPPIESGVPKETPMTVDSSVDYQFDVPFAVQEGNNNIELDLAKAKKLTR